MANTRTPLCIGLGNMKRRFVLVVCWIQLENQIIQNNNLRTSPKVPKNCTSKSIHSGNDMDYGGLVQYILQLATFKFGEGVGGHRGIG